MSDTIVVVSDPSTVTLVSEGTIIITEVTGTIGPTGAGGGGGGSSLTVQVNDVTQGTDISTLDFSSEFSVTETPDGEANITIGSAIARDSEVTSAVASHESDTTNVHGIADTSVLETTTGAQAKADAKVQDTIANGETTKAPSQNAVFDALALKADQSSLDNHLNDISDAHDASAISYAGNTNLSATDVEAALDELDNEKAAATDLTNHLNDTSDAHDASAISYAGGTGMSATDVEAAIDELANEKEDTANKSTATDLGGGSPSNTLFPTQAAVKAYADALIAANDAMTFEGVIDCSANPNYPAADAGHTYKVSVAGKIGGGSGPNVEAGDMVICTVDGTVSGTHGAVGANWAIIQTNVDGAVTGPASSTDSQFATFNGTTGKVIKDSGLALDTDTGLAANSDTKIPSQKAVKAYADTKQAGDSDLTAIAGLSPANDDIIQRKAGAWTNRTMAQLKADIPASSTTTGVVELATAAETTTGTDDTRAVTPDGLAGSDYGKRVVSIQVTDPSGSAITTGDGKAYFRVPAVMNGYNLVAVAAHVTTVSSSGTPTIQINNVTQAADMLTTRITIDANEKDSATAATAAVIDTGNDDVATADELRIDVDVAGTGAKGLIVEMTFQLP